MTLERFFCRKKLCSRQVSPRQKHAGRSSFFLFSILFDKTERDRREVSFNLPQPNVTDRKLYATISAGFPFFFLLLFLQRYMLLESECFSPWQPFHALPQKPTESFLKKHIFFLFLSYPCLELFMTVRLRDIMF